MEKRTLTTEEILKRGAKDGIIVAAASITTGVLYNSIQAIKEVLRNMKKS